MLGHACLLKMEAYMTTDSERNYKGTNFAVTVLVVLLLLVGGYFVVMQIADLADDPTMADTIDNERSGAITSSPAP